MLVTTQTVAILLAAGGSSRLGQPKQLLSWQGRPLLVHTMEQLLQAGCDHLFIILGAHAEQCTAAYRESISKVTINKARITLAHNVNWHSGQASSLHFGLQLVPSSVAAPCKTLVALCDQPLIMARHYRSLIDSVDSTGESLVAATSYSEGAGVPACFHYRCLSELAGLQGDVGAKAWIRGQNSTSIRSLDFGDATRDIDTLDDWATLGSESHSTIWR